MVAGAGQIADLNRPILPRCGAHPGDDEIVVCGRGDSSRYRLPPARRGFDPNGPVDSVALERHRLMDVGASGIGSCSTVGAGGWTGCWARAVRQSELQGRRTGLLGIGEHDRAQSDESAVP
jgi:hypothetical protein